MARKSIEETAAAPPSGGPSVLPVGTHRALMVTDIEYSTNTNGNRYMDLTVTDVDPDSATIGGSQEDRQYGFTSDKDTPYVERIVDWLIKCALATVPKIEGDVQPYQSFDWERRDDVAACIIGARFSAAIELEKGSKRDDGTFFADKNRINYSTVEPTAAELLKPITETEAYKAMIGAVKARRTAAIEAWRKGLDGGDGSDDDIPF